jgi:hypothetical protein
MMRPPLRTLAFVFVGLGLFGCKKKPDGVLLKLTLAAEQAGQARIRTELIEDGDAKPVVDMRLPWKVLAQTADGPASLRLGPPTFPGATTPSTTPQAWPAGSTALVQLDALDHDSRWQTEVPDDAPYGAKVILEQLLTVRYSAGVGIVALPAKPIRVGETWSVEDPPAGGVHTHRQSRLVSFDGKRARIAVDEESKVDDSPAHEHIKGEIVYALDQPLPVGGWLRIESRTADGHQRTIAYLYGK